MGKAAERLLRRSFEDFFGTAESSGANQFAYKKEHGARDLLALLALTWLSGFQKGRKYLFYCSDVAGAFDRVDAQRFTETFEALGVPRGG